MINTGIAVRRALFVALLCSCSRPKTETLQTQIEQAGLLRGEITLCGSGEDRFGTASFDAPCSADVKPDFDLGIALLHSFEYTEAEKVFARVIDRDPRCAMAYWGAAMANFHQLWMPPSPAELKKGAKLVAIARSLLPDTASREARYVGAISRIYDNWERLDHRTRLRAYEEASRRVYEQYPDDDEAAIFYSLALTAAADPADKSFTSQRKAGAILNALFARKPDHPGVAHYLIHTYDYPELAHLGLAAARKYASIAAASAHAQHMPSHIFTRLGYWDESIASDRRSVEAARCYAESSGMKGHWDEELHGLDYLTHALLQKGDDAGAREIVRYLGTITTVFPVNFKVAYCFAALPARDAVERRDWESAAALKLSRSIPWEKFPWEKANVHFARFLGNYQLNRIDSAAGELLALDSLRAELSRSGESYKANLVMIQVTACKAWLVLARGDKRAAIRLMTAAAEMEDGTTKHPVTPGEIIPARELLGEIYVKTGEYGDAAKAFEATLKKCPNRLNSLYGAALAFEKLGETHKARRRYEEVLLLARGSTRPVVVAAERFLMPGRKPVAMPAAQNLTSAVD